MKKKSIPFLNIQKRDGSVVPFDEKRITRAIFRAMNAASEGGEKQAEEYPVPQSGLVYFLI